MITLIIISCLPTIMTNNTRFNWNDFDYKTLDRARQGCGRIYKDAPCVKVFIKKDKQDYSVICGKKGEV